MSVGATLLLETPSGRVGEVETARSWARSSLLEIPTDINAREGTSLLDDAACVCVVAMNVHSCLKVLVRVL